MADAPAGPKQPTAAVSTPASPAPSDPGAAPSSAESQAGTSSATTADPQASVPAPSVWAKLSPRMWFHKETPEIWAKEGDRLIGIGNRNQALIAFHKALTLDPGYAEAHRG